MVPQARTRFANSLLMLASWPAARGFAAAARAPRAAQSAILRRTLAANADTDYGRAHGFDRIDSLEAYRAKVPAVGYDELAPWIARIMDGAPGVLTREPVLMLERTGGSIAPAKHVPYTATLRRQFQSAVSAWLFDLLARRPVLRGLGAYWSVSPIGRERERTAGGLPIGFDDDAEYLAPLERWIMAQVLRSPRRLHEAPDLASCRYVTLRHLLQADDLGMASVWHPSFLTLLVEAAAREGDRLVHDLRRGTLSPPGAMPASLHAALERGLAARPEVAQRLERALRRGPPLGPALFPHLRLISCWTDAMAAQAVPALAACFPGVEIQGKGLLATEGVVSIPLLGQAGAVLALGSHFYEFVPAGGSADAALPADQLEVGASYEVLITTGGGFYRYRLRDVVRVIGRWHGAPRLVFLGRADRTSDLVGEKLHEQHVAALLARALPNARFAMLAPEAGSPPHYGLFVDGEPTPGALAVIEAGLRENPHYAYARALGQLGAPTLYPLSPDAQARYLEACMAMGQRAGDVKPTSLHPAPGWRARFGLLAEEAAG